MVIVMHEWLVEFGKASHNWCLPQPEPELAREKKVRTTIFQPTAGSFSWKMQHLSMTCSTYNYGSLGSKKNSWT